MKISLLVALILGVLAFSSNTALATHWGGISTGSNYGGPPIVKKRYTKKKSYRKSARRSKRRTTKRSRKRSRSYRTVSVSSKCLNTDAKHLLTRIEARFGKVHLISTCRAGATIAGSGRPSKHRNGKAIDFAAPKGMKAAIVAWLRKSHNSGGTMTYRDMGHIHVDIGRKFVALNRCSYKTGRCGKRRTAKKRRSRRRRSRRG